MGILLREEKVGGGVSITADGSYAGREQTLHELCCKEIGWFARTGLHLKMNQFGSRISFSFRHVFSFSHNLII